MNRLTRSAPAVRYSMWRSAGLGVALGLILLAGAAVLAAWAFWGAHSSLVNVITAACAWVIAAAGAFHFWLMQWVGMLCWDGRAWSVETPAPMSTSWALSESPEVFLDLQSHLWLRVSLSGSRGVWVWLQRSSQPERWLDLRRAVYSRARSGADNAVEKAPASSREG